ncbi:MAG: hypothetical protein JXA89_04680 [Anaerolineae bacterium]|nr:hypothetical protein [Anaerolineae bacterium]
MYGIIKQANGHIEVESQIGEGSLFQIYLPRVKADIATSEPSPRTDASMRGAETALLVEDEDSVRELVCRALERQGYIVLFARPGGKPAAVSLVGSPRVVAIDAARGSPVLLGFVFRVPELLQFGQRDLHLVGRRSQF